MAFFIKLESWSGKTLINPFSLNICGGEVAAPATSGDEVNVFAKGEVVSSFLVTT